MPTCEHVAVHEVVELALADLRLRPRGDDAACPDVVVVGQKLCHVGLYLAVGVDLADGSDGRLLQSHVIIIGGRDDREFRPCVDHAPPLPVGEQAFVLLDAVEPLLGFLVVVVEFLVKRLALAETHELDVGHQQLHLVVGCPEHGVEPGVGLREAHLHQVGECEVVQGLRPSGIVPFRQSVRPPGIQADGVEVAVMEGVCLVVAGISLLLVGDAACRRQQHGQQCRPSPCRSV